MKTVYQQRVDKIYENLTDEQLMEQIKNCAEKRTIGKRYGKLERAVEELSKRWVHEIDEICDS